jgi:hypothetical protein
MLIYGKGRAARRLFLYGLSMTENRKGGGEMKRITTYKEYKTLKAIYKNSQIVSVSDSDALIFIRK